MNTAQHDPLKRNVGRAQKKSSSMSVSIFSALVLVALIMGWQISDEYYFTAQHGVGYAMGVVGGSMMLLLLIYPIKKRFHHSPWFIFSTRSWFRIHMILGILGPSLILYHCNFRLGSTNSNVALGSMLLMVSSGLFGRYIYSKIHYGLYGKKILLEELLRDKLFAKRQLEKDECVEHSLSDEHLATIKRYEQRLQFSPSVMRSLVSGIVLGITTRIDQRQIAKELVHGPQEHLLHLQTYLHAVRKVAAFMFYERLFSLWHMLHMPIFFMLVITGLLHVYAVHVY